MAELILPVAACQTPLPFIWIPSPLSLTDFTQTSQQSSSCFLRIIKNWELNHSSVTPELSGETKDRGGSASKSDQRPRTGMTEPITADSDSRIQSRAAAKAKHRAGSAGLWLAPPRALIPSEVDALGSGVGSKTEILKAEE